MQTLAVQLKRREDFEQVATRLKNWYADSFDFLEAVQISIIESY
jgi:hypothetical protein